MLRLEYADHSSCASCMLASGHTCNAGHIHDTPVYIPEHDAFVKLFLQGTEDENGAKGSL